jgi:hypothetical protein
VATTWIGVCSTENDDYMELLKIELLSNQNSTSVGGIPFPVEDVSDKD